MSVSHRRRLISMLLFYLGFAAWFGAMLLFITAIAAVVFKELSHDAAGNLNAIILHRLNILSLCAALLMLLGSAIHNVRLSGITARLPFVIIVLILILLGIYEWGIGGRMLELRTQIGSFDIITQSDEALRQEFTTLHRWYSALAGINLGLVVLLFFWQSVLFATASRLAKGESLLTIALSLFPISRSAPKPD